MLGACALPLILWGCVEKQSVAPALANRGLVPLSGDNPFVGSNVFIADEARRSPVLFRFLESRGAPQAIRVDETEGGNPLMTMIYSREREQYLAERLPVARDAVEVTWVIRGPYSFDDIRLSREVQRLSTAEPVFSFDGKVVRFRSHERAVPGINKPVPLPRIIPTSTPRPRPKAKVEPTPEAATPVPATPFGPVPTPTPNPDGDPLVGRPVTADLLAIIRAQGFAERNASGDLIHTVRGDRDTSLAAIAAWYTGSEQNATSLAATNSMTDVTAPLTIGQRILVPRVLLTKFRPLQ